MGNKHAVPTIDRAATQDSAGIVRVGGVGGVAQALTGRGRPQVLQVPRNAAGKYMVHRVLATLSSDPASLDPYWDPDGSRVECGIDGVAVLVSGGGGGRG